MAHVYLSADAHGCPPWQHCVGVCISWTYWSQRISAAFLFFQSDPLRLNAALSLSLPLRLYLSRSERKRDRNTWTRVRLRRCLQAWVSNPPLSSGCLFKMKEVFFYFSLNLHFFSVTCGSGINLTGLIIVFIMLAFMRNCPYSRKVAKTWFLALTDRKTTFKHLSHINFHKIMSKTIIQIMMATCNVFMMDPFLFLFLC